MNNSLRILLVEDNPGDADLIMELLSKKGSVSSVVECAPRLAVALELLKQNRFDVVLLDLGLPDSAGLDTVRVMEQQIIDTPVVVLTGNNDEQMGLAAIQVGAQDYVVKGQINGSLLLQVLRYALERHQNARRLRESEAFVKSVLNSLSSHVAVLDEKGSIIAINDAWKTFARENNSPDPDFYLGCNYLLITENAATRDGDQIAMEVWRGVRAVLEGQQDLFSLEYPCHSPDAKRWFTLRVTPRSGEHQGVVIAHDNITERKLAEETLQNQNLILSSLINSPQDTIIFSIDREYRYTSFNEMHRTEMRKVWDVDIEIGMNLLDCLTIPALRESAKQSINQALGGEAFIDIQFQPGVNIYYEFSWNPIRQNDSSEVVGVTVFIRNISERMQAEIEIHRLNAELEQRVVERTIQLENTNQELEAFVYSVAHDLRAPLRGIDGWSHILLEENYDQLNEQGRESLNFIRSETRRMGLVIENLLQLSRISRTEMQREQVDLTALAQTIILRLQCDQPRPSAEAIIQPGLTARGDNALLEIVLTNLLDNAWKYTGTRPIARIELGQAEVKGQPTFFVRDNGVGFDMAYAQKLFGVFQRMHRAEEFPGTGIGLAIVQRIVQRHGGKVWAEAQVNQGATFYFTLEEAV
jgi:signal transduction histidine kinase/DNA-binding response OmpR family regulator